MSEPNLRELFLECLATLESAFRVFEAVVPQPKWVVHKDEFYYRYTERTIQQALVLKLARYLSSLHAVDVLLLHGLLQEQGSIHRILDEVQEDIVFLAVALTDGPVTPLHARYLTGFWAEMDSLARAKKPDVPPRRKIRAYVARLLRVPNPSAAHDAGETLSTVYSGYVHASAQNIMDLYGGSPPHFHVSGMLGTPLMCSHVKDARNVFFRGILSTIVTAKAFGNQVLVDSLTNYLHHFETASGGDLQAQPA